MSLNQPIFDPIKFVDGEEAGGGHFGNLFGFPEDCVSSIISFTSPRDACVLACVSKSFLSAARSDVVWEKFLPVDCMSLVPPSLSWSSKKELFFALSNNHVLVDGGRKSFWLEKRSGKKCYMLSARELGIVWGDTPAYWSWISLPESRFSETAELINVCWLEIHGKMNTQLLSPETKYSAFLVFKLGEESYGFLSSQVVVGIGVGGKETQEKNVWLDFEHEEENGNPIPSRHFGMSDWRSGPSRLVYDPDMDVEGDRPKERRDRWMEIELGEFFNDGVADEEVEMIVMEVKGGHWKSGLIVQGIEIRPKE